MPVIHDALREELERLLEKEQAYKKQLSLLPKGRIHDKSIGGKKYPYLTYREDGKVKSRYVKPEELEQVMAQVEQRQQHEKSLKSIRADLRVIRKVVKVGK